MPKAIDITGQRFGRLVAIRPTEERIVRQVVWECKCDCGNIVNVSGVLLRCGDVKSCGCLNVERARERGKAMGANNMKKANEKMRVDGVMVSHLYQKTSRANTSGFKGVCWDKRRGKWLSYINLKGNRVNLGGFDNLGDAASARKEAEEKYFKPVLEKYGMAVSD